MSDFSAFMYAAYTPLPVYKRPKKHRSHSSPRIRRPFQHSRSSSGSQPGRSSHDTGETNTTGSSGQSDRPATAAGAAASSASSSAAAAGDHERRQDPQGHGVDGPGSSRTPSHASSAANSRLQSLYGLEQQRPSPSLASGSPFNPSAAPRLPMLNDRRMPRPPASHGLTTATPEHKHGATYTDQEGGKASVSRPVNPAFPRTDSVSSTSVNTTLSARTVTSSDPSSDESLASKPFVFRNGRTYLNDPSLCYPLPSDLTELHRQSLRTLLLIQVFGGPVCSPALTTKPPQRVLELGCGSGFWSMMCHRYFKSRGHSGISFTGMDVAPLAPGSANIAADAIKPDRDMKWTFVNHDMRQMPWPLPDDEFDLVMVKDMSIAITNVQQPAIADEYLRLLKPGGTLEIWESDHSIRMLRPHVPGAASSGDANDEQEAASSLGAYIMTANTPLSAPLNPFLVEYNHWVSRALEMRDISTVPCTVIGPALLQEAEILADVRSRRMAVPFSEVRWEREGVGGVVTKDGKSYVEMKGKGALNQKVDNKKTTLNAGQAALRRTALLTVVQQIQALEPLLREVSGKSQDEWDVWQGKMMSDLMNEGGTSWGECLEVGAWWAQKKKAT